MSSESERIERLARRFARRNPGDTRGARILRGIGDDAAVVAASGVVVTSVDAIVDGVHFNSAYAPPRAIGFKAAAAALSDIAAMGAAAGEIYMAAGLPAGLSEDDFDAIVDGIDEAATACGAAAAGGDLTASPVLWISVTAVGHADGENTLAGRDSARPGDLLAVTGTLGGSTAGQLLLRDPALATAAGLSESTAAALRERHLFPTPRFAAGRALIQSGATAMIDLSDGLARDAGQLARASSVCANLRLADLPLSAGVAALAEFGGSDPGSFAAESGEEYELLCTLPATTFNAARAAVEKTGVELTAIGKAQATGAGEPAGATFLDRQGRPVVVTGYEHFN